MESSRVKFAGAGKKLFPKSPLPSNKSPWQKKQCLVYKMPPWLIASGSFFNGLTRSLSDISFPLRVKDLGISSDGGEDIPHAGADNIMEQKRNFHYNNNRTAILADMVV